MRHSSGFGVPLAVAALVSCQKDRGTVVPAALDRSLTGSGAVGVSIAVRFPDGGLWTGAAGMSGDGVPLQPAMLLGIGSAEMSLQAALALKLIEERMFGLDDPLSKWLPPMPHIDGAITIRQRMHMTSGIDDFVGDPESPSRIGYRTIDFGKM